MGEDQWRWSLIVMDAATGELMLLSGYHEGRLRRTEGQEDLSASCGAGVVSYSPSTGTA